MDYKQIEQCSRKYKYGENKEFKTKHEAEEAIKTLEQQVKTKLALLKIYDVSEIKIIEGDNAIMLLVKTKIPNIFQI